jgi:NHLM bacteriocin system ABC transporter peptidase/ATP-binding protein
MDRCGMMKFLKKKSIRVKTPTVFQMETVECGAAALSIILSYYGCFVTLEQLRVDCGITRDGCTAINIIRAAKKYGLKGEGYKISLDDLCTLEVPLIVFWRFNHFIVLEGIVEEKVYINDPVMGPYVINKAEFERSFTGVVLTFVPTKKFVKSGGPPRIIHQIYKRLEKHRKSMAYIFAAGLVFTVVGLIIPIFSKVFVDYFLVNKMQTILRPLLIGIFLTAILRWTLSFIQNIYLVKLENKLSLVFSSEFLWHLLQLPINFFSLRYTGDITSRMLLNQKVAKFIASVFVEAILNAIFVVLYALLLFYYNPLLMMVATAVAGINIAIFYKIARIRRDKSLLLSYDLGAYYGNAYNAFKIIESIKASAQEENIFEKIVGSQVKASNTIHDLNKQTIIYNALPVILNNLNGAIILILGAIQVMNGTLSVGTLVAIQSLTLSYIAPLNRLITILSQIQEMSGTIAKLDDVLRYERDNKIHFVDFTSGKDLLTQESVKLSGLIELKNVSFGYNKLEKALIKDISLIILPGEHVAIVGSSGAGKSTFAKLISNLYAPWSGEIKVDQKDINSIHRMILINSFSLVEQENVMFNSSIKENITMWDHTIRYQDMIQAAKDAAIHDEISLRQQGYDSMVYQQASNFSGGQRQRIELARALVTNPSILIMDEATSELDPLTENEIYNNIRRRGCTTIIIAHRLSTIKNADKIVVLDKGKIVQLGTHDELIVQKGCYQDLMVLE